MKSFKQHLSEGKMKSPIPSPDQVEKIIKKLGKTKVKVLDTAHTMVDNSSFYVVVKKSEDADIIAKVYNIDSPNTMIDHYKGGFKVSIDPKYAKEMMKKIPLKDIS